MTRQKALRLLGMFLLASLTTLALAVDLAVTPVTMVTDASAATRVYYQLLALKKSITWSHPALCLAAYALMELYMRTLSSRVRAGKALLALFLSACSLISRAVQQQQTLAVLWASALQPVKALLCFAGMAVLWLALIRGAQRCVAWVCTQKPRAFRHPMRTPFLIMLAAWTPLMLIRYPGVFIPDIINALREYLGTVARGSTNPAAHTLVVGLLTELCAALGSPQAGVFLYVLLQAAALMACLAWFVNLLQQLEAPAPVMWAAMLLPVLSPLYASYATMVLKDTACALGVLLFTIQTGLLLARPDVFWKRPAQHLALWGAGAAAGVLMRTNGVLFILPPMAAALLWQFGQKDAKRSRRMAAAFAAALVVTGGLQLAANREMNYGEGSVREMLSIPFQQTARTLREHDVPADELAVIDRVLDANAITLVYQHYLADPVKNTFRPEATEADVQAYLRVWAKQLVRYPLSAADAFVGMTHAVFSPDYMQLELATTGIEGTLKPGWNVGDWYRAQPLTRLDGALTGLQTLSSVLPFIGLLTNLGTFSCAMLITWRIMWQRRRRLWMLWLPSVLCVGMLFLSPITLTRYALPLFFTLPVAVGYLCTAQHEG